MNKVIYRVNFLTGNENSFGETMRYTCDHSGDRTQMCITCMNYESKIHSLRTLVKDLGVALKIAEPLVDWVTVNGDEKHEAVLKALLLIPEELREERKPNA